MGRSNIAIIIPAKNEALTIKKVISHCSNYGTVIVIDDASRDETGKISKLSGAIVLKNKKNLFYDESLNKGFNYARKKKFQLIITIDADGQHEIKKIPQFVKFLNSGYDLILGKRKKLPRISEKIISLYFIKKFKIKDIYCGMKGYNFNRLDKFKTFDRFGSIGTDLATRIMNNKKFKFKEISIKIKKRKDEPRIGNIFFANLRIYKSFLLNLIINSNK
jgi:glycosyltransferase involved in cell wall biosynthesis